MCSFQLYTRRTRTGRGSAVIGGSLYNNIKIITNIIFIIFIISTYSLSYNLLEYPDVPNLFPRPRRDSIK